MLDNGIKEIKSRGQSQTLKGRGDFTHASVCEITAEKPSFTPDGV